MALKPTSYSAQSIAVEYVIVQLTTLRMQESNAMVCMCTITNPDPVFPTIASLHDLCVKYVLVWRVCV